MSTRDELCRFCGAYSPRQCELEEEMGVCPWAEMGGYDDEPDPDRLREDRDERAALDREKRS